MTPDSHARETQPHSYGAAAAGRPATAAAGRRPLTPDGNPRRGPEQTHERPAARSPLSPVPGPSSRILPYST
jgi:hypothetical protein